MAGERASMNRSWKYLKGQERLRSPRNLLPCSPDMATPFPGDCISHASEENCPCFHLVTLPTWLYLVEPGVDRQLHLGQWDSPSPRIEELK